jgi:UDP:flavonoid glycosyltransferase YjiC (YdhE family)
MIQGERMVTKGKGAVKNRKNNTKPLIGFFPYFDSLGEVIPLVKIAQVYMTQGGDAVFFSHGGRCQYEYMAEEIGCKIIQLNSWWTEEFKKKNKRINEGEKVEKRILSQYNEQFVKNAIEKEIEAFQRTGIKLLVCGFNLTSNIPAKVAGIPQVVIISGTMIPPFLTSDTVTFPDNYENAFTRLVPHSIKDPLTRWYLVHNKMLVRRFNKFAKQFHVPPFRYFNDLLLGDYPLVCDDINFLGLSPTKEFPLENFIGPIFHGNVIREQKGDIDTKVLSHLQRPGKSILISMGSSGDKQVFLEMLEALNTTTYNVIALSANMFLNKSLIKTNENILLREYVPSLETVLQHVDLAVIHGGRGTVYTIAYSGKPAIGLPIFLEQQYNIDNLVRHGGAIRLSKKNFSQTQFLEAIEKIFDNYADYSRNAKELAKKLVKHNGEERAVERIIEILSSNEERKKKME